MSKTNEKRGTRSFLPPILLASILIGIILYVSGGDMWLFKMPFTRTAANVAPVFAQDSGPQLDPVGIVIMEEPPVVELEELPPAWPRAEFPELIAFDGELFAVEYDNGYACVALSAAQDEAIAAYIAQLTDAGAIKLVETESEYICLIDDVEVHVIKDIPPFIELCGEPKIDAASDAFIMQYPDVNGYTLPKGGRLVKVTKEEGSNAHILTYRAVTQDDLKAYRAALASDGFGTSETSDIDGGGFYAFYQHNLRTLVIDYFAQGNEFTVRVDAVSFD